MSVLDVNEITDKEFNKVLDKLSAYKNSVLEADLKIGYNTEQKEIRLGIGFYNGVNNKFEITIKKTSYSISITYQKWREYHTMGVALHRVTFPAPIETNIVDLIPKDEDTLFKIIDEYKYKSEFEKRTFEELKELL